MSKKKYLLMVFLVGGIITSVHIDAKPVSTSNPAGTSNEATSQQPKGNAASSNNSTDEQASRPQINQIRFSGNTTISSEELKKDIPLKVNEVANEYIITNSMVKIAQLYKAKNIKVTIAPVLEESSNNTMNIQFDIHEMPMEQK